MRTTHYKFPQNITNALVSFKRISSFSHELNGCCINCIILLMKPEKISIRSKEFREMESGFMFFTNLIQCIIKS